MHLFRPGIQAGAKGKANGQILWYIMLIHLAETQKIQTKYPFSYT